MRTETLKQRLKTQFIGKQLILFEEVSSTNEVAKELAARHIVFQIPHIPERAIQDFFRTKIMNFESNDGLMKFIEGKYGCQARVYEYIGPDITIGV